MGATDSGAMDGAVKKIQSNSAVKSGLSGSVGIKGANAPGDVWKVSSALTNNGLMAAPQRHADNTLFTSITKAQENMDSSLKRDGLVNPGGPTESTYTRYVGQGFMKPPTNPLDERKPSPTDSNGYKPLGTGADVLKRERAEEQVETQRARIQRQAERLQERKKAEAATRAMRTQSAPGLNSGLSTPIKPETVKKVVDGLGTLANKVVSTLSGEGGGTAAPNAAKPPALSDEAYASNRRTADALGRYKGVGDLPRFTSDAINTNGEKAVHEVADMIGQVHARSPEQAQELFDKTAQGIAPENRALFEWAMDGHIADQKAASQPTEAPDAGSPSTASRPSEQDQANALIDQVAAKMGLDKKDARGLKDSFAKGGDDANAVKRFLWENRDAFADGRTDVAASPRPGDPGTSQDEQGNWFDMDGRPLKNVPNPLLQKTQMFVPPATAAGASGAAVGGGIASGGTASATDVEKAFEKPRRDFQK